jgi:hypothetical protein
MTRRRHSKTVSVRIPLEEAEAIERQARGRGFKNLNQYLLAALRLLGPLSQPVEQPQHAKPAELPETVSQ